MRDRFRFYFFYLERVGTNTNVPPPYPLALGSYPRHSCMVSDGFSPFELCIYAAVVGACVSLLIGCFIEIHRFINEVVSTRKEKDERVRN